MFFYPWRMLRRQAYKCDACLNKFLSLLTSGMHNYRKYLSWSDLFESHTSRAFEYKLVHWGCWFGELLAEKILKKLQQNHSYLTKGNHLFFISLISRFREASSAICWPFPPIPGELRTTPGGNCPRMYCCCAAGIVYIVPVLLTWTCYRNKWKKCKTVKVSNPSMCPIPWEPILSQ